MEYKDFDTDRWNSIKPLAGVASLEDHKVVFV